MNPQRESLYASQCGRSYEKTNLIVLIFLKFYIQNYGSNFCHLIYPACEFYCSLSKLKQYERHLISVDSTDNSIFHPIEYLLSMILNECGLEWFLRERLRMNTNIWQDHGFICTRFNYSSLFLSIFLSTAYLYINAKVEKY